MMKYFTLFLAVLSLPLFAFSNTISKAEIEQKNAQSRLEDFRKNRNLEREKLISEIESLTKKTDELSQKLYEAKSENLSAEFAEKNLALKNSDFKEFRNSSLSLSKKLNEMGFNTNAPASPSLAFFESFKDLVENADSVIFSNSVLSDFLCEVSKDEFVRNFESCNSQKILVDVSLGKLKISSDKSLFKTLKSGGIFMCPILFFGVISFIVCAVKIAKLLAQKKANDATISAISESLKNPDSEITFAEIEPLKTSSFKRVLEGILSRKNLAKQEMENFAEILILKEFERYSKGAGFLSLTASVAPLLGLLGTVSGIIKTFSTLSVFGTSNPQMMSGGIAEALITTEFGLIVAIPAFLASAFFARKAKAFEVLLIDFSNSVIAKITK